MTSLAEINGGDAGRFVDLLGEVFENSSWLVERAAAARPYPSREALVDTLVAAMHAAAPDEQLALIRAHPDLAGKAARRGTLTVSSSREQASAGLGQLSDDEFAMFGELNAAYRARFGFPFIVAVRDHSKETVLAAFRARLDNDPHTEIAEAMRNIARIVALRVLDMVSE